MCDEMPMLPLDMLSFANCERYGKCLSLLGTLGKLLGNPGSSIWGGDGGVNASRECLERLRCDVQIEGTQANPLPFH